jgi:putative ABC transport system permease protein
MLLTENIKEALRSLIGAKQRTLLALLGIVIGIGSVIAMISVGTIVQNEALRQFKEMGTDILKVRSEYRQSQRKNEGFSLDSVMRLTPSCDLISTSTPQTSSYGKLQYSGESKDIPALGITQAAQDLFKIDLQQGRFISNLDENMFYCVIGSKVKNFLRQNGLSEPLGQKILFKKKYFKIIGVAQNLPMNSMRPYQLNEGIMIPISTSFRFPRAPKIQDVTARVAQGGDIKSATEQLKNYFQAQDKVKVRVTSAEELINRMQKQMRMFTLLLGAIGSISLIVGGVGVMNVMLVSVSERKREIGIRRALGAKRMDIQTQFLIESLILCFVGGIIGIILGIGASYFIARFSDWQFMVSSLAILLGVGVSALVGLFFGFYPARQAAKLSPIEALRSE